MTVAAAPAPAPAPDAAATMFFLILLVLPHLHQPRTATHEQLRWLHILLEITSLRDLQTAVVVLVKRA